MSDEILIVRDNGNLVGSDGDHLYDGVRVQTGYDELTVTTVVAEDGLSFERTTTLPDGLVRSATRLEFEGFCEAALPKVLAGLRSDLEREPTQEEIDAGLAAAWETEKGLTAHGKVFMDALVDGELVSVEKKITHIDWTVR